MLKLLNIKKSYTTGGLIQHALDDVSLDLRENEFVAILGPSGSGKTTLLNVIGGLDHYDSGDLIIDGISTKKYKDRDWDSYRNHSVGFVFQSYNLIPHQTILANVELALTISGIGKRERTRRAKEALKKVGLESQSHKLPEQLSGGQMQRVAIARALVNNPKILLADEPTGALDSETSVMVMELLKEVAHDRLVVMVTHNPELANTYATRIINLRDGRIRSDSNPIADFEETKEPTVIKYKNMGKSSMSFLTALSLSFNNLKTKKARTFLTSFAGSIGIIGIALILAASAGINDYIAAEQEAMLYAYPIEILSTSFDMMSFITPSTSSSPDEDGIGVSETLTRLFSTVGSNDLQSLREYLESDNCDIDDYVNAIEYTYDIEPQIFLYSNDEYTQVNPYSTLSVINTGILSSDASPLSSLFSTSVFYQLPLNENVYSGEYEVVAGRLPESYDEVVVVLSPYGNISDIMTYALGLRDSLELEDMLDDFAESRDADVPEDFGTYSYDDILGTEYKLVYSTDYYEYDSEYDVWVDKSDNDSYVQSLAENGETLTVVGILQSSSDSESSLLDTGIYYTFELTEHIIEKAAETEVVQAQLENPDIDIFTGEAFRSSSDSSDTDLSSLFNIDDDIIAEAFDFDASELEEALQTSDISEYMDVDSGSIDLSDMADLGDITFEIADIETESISLSDILSEIDLTVSSEDMASIAASLMSGYLSYIEDIPQADVSRLAGSLSDYLSTQDARDIIVSNINEIIQENGDVSITGEDISALGSALMSGFQTYASQQGYTDGTQLADYFAEFLQTDDAKNIVSAWALENIEFSELTVTEEQLQKLVSELSAGYGVYAEANLLPTAQTIGEYFLEYLATDEASQIITNGILSAIDLQNVEDAVSSTIEDYIGAMMSAYGDAISSAIGSSISYAVQSVMEQLTDQLTSVMETAMSSLADTISSEIEAAFSVDSEALADAFGLSLDATQLTELLTTLTSSGSTSYADNLSALGYADMSDPYSINIYPKDFDSKQLVIDILNDYNTAMESAGEDDKVISFSDTTSTLMSSVTDMINIISAVMIAIVAISLIVSSIMISVITYISVLERKKEIGILRALGASRRNVSSVFNAETIIIGLCSGLLGVVVASLLTIPINSLIYSYTNMDNVSIYLPMANAVMLVAISVGLTLFSGLVPSSKAAKSDPVEALRTE